MKKSVLFILPFFYLSLLAVRSLKMNHAQMFILFVMKEFIFRTLSNLKAKRMNGFYHLTLMVLMGKYGKHTTLLL
jgi:hypothetical protein